MSQRKKVAALISEYRLHSHADVIVGRLLGGYYYDGQHNEPRVELVSMYTDQVPDMDMSRDLAAKYGFKIYPSIRQALTLKADESRGPRELAVDGVVLICEHGAYPYNPLGQKLYPRHDFFKAMVDVFRETGQTAPVFHDKHFSYDWYKAKWMYDQARALGFPLMAGSVIPLGRHPELRWEMGRPMDKAIYRLNGFEGASSFAALAPGGNGPVVVPDRGETPRPVHLPEELRERYPVANHFSATTHLFEEMLVSGQAPHPAERTLLTTGALAALFESSYAPAPNYGETYQHGLLLEEGKRVETPHLHIAYQVEG